MAVTTYKAFTFETEDDKREREVRQFESGAAKLIDSLTAPTRELKTFLDLGQQYIDGLQRERDDEVATFTTAAKDYFDQDDQLANYAQGDTISRLFGYNEDTTPIRQSPLGKIIQTIDTVKRIRDRAREEQAARETEAERTLKEKQLAAYDIYGSDRPVDPLVSFAKQEIEEGRLRYASPLETGLLAASIAFIGVPPFTAALLGEAGAKGAAQITEKAGLGEAPGYWLGTALTAIATPLTLPEEIAFKALGKVVASAARYTPFLSTLLKRSQRLVEEAATNKALQEAAVPSVSGAANVLPALDSWRTIENGLLTQTPDLLQELGEGLSTTAIGKRIVTWLGGAAALARVNPTMRLAATRSLSLNKWLARVDFDRLALDMDFEKAFAKADRARVWVLDAAGKRVKATIDDIGFHPEKFSLTPDQTKVLRDNRVWFESLVKEYESVTGVSFEDLGLPMRNFYWPRIVLDEAGNAYIPTRLGAKFPFERPMIFDYMDDGIKAGVPYASPTEAARLFGHSIYRAIADDLFMDGLRTLPGTAPMKEWLKVQRAMLNKVVKDKAIREQDPIRWARANARLKSLRNKISPELIGRRDLPSGAKLSFSLANLRFDKEMFKDLELVLGPGNSLLNKVSIVNTALRITTTGLGDMGHFFIQGLPLLGRNPKMWANSVYHSLEAMVTPKRFARWVVKNGQAFADAGGYIGIGTEFTRIPGKIGPVALQSIITPPGLRAVPRGFEGFIDAGRILTFNSLMKAGDVAPNSFEAMRLARYVDTMFGVTDVGALGRTTASGQAENAFLFFSPRYTRSVLGMMAYLFSKGTTQKEAARALAGMTVATVAIYIGVAKKAGLSDEEIIDRINPSSALVRQSPSKLMSIPIGNIEYGIGGQYRANVAAIAGMIDKKNWTFESWEDALLRNPIVMRMRAVQAPATGRIVDYIDGEDFLGRRVGPDELVSNPLLIKEEVARWAPLTAQAAIEANVDWEERLAATGFSAIGGRTRMISPWDVKDDVTQELSGDGVKRYRDADLPLRQRVDEDPRVIEANKRIADFRRRKGNDLQAAIDEVDKYRLVVKESQEKIDADLQIGNADSVDLWRERTRRLQIESAARRDQIYKDFDITFEEEEALPKVRLAVEQYFDVDPNDPKYQDPITKRIRFDWVEKDREKVLEGLTEDEQKAVDDYLTKHMTETQIEARKAGKLLNEAPTQYQGISDEQYAQYQQFAKHVKAVTRMEASANISENDPQWQVKEREIALREADKFNRPWLADIFEVLQTESGRNRLTNLEYVDYLIRHQKELEPWFPELYSQEFFKKALPPTPYTPPVFPEPTYGTPGGERRRRVIIAGSSGSLPDPRPPRR